MPPIRRSLRVNAGEDHRPDSECSLHDGRSSVRILTDNRTPAGKLCAILPVLIERWCSSQSDWHHGFADTTIFRRVETEPHTRSQIQTVKAGIPRKERTRTDSE